MKIAFTTANIHGEFADLDDETAQRHIDAGHAYAVIDDDVETAEAKPALRKAVRAGKHETRA